MFPTEAWRLLLPELSPERVVALGDGPVAATARRLWPMPNAGWRNDGQVDLIVADSSDADTVDVVAELLGPKSVAYLQFDWPRHRTYDELQDRLDRAGLPVAALYSISPGRSRWAATWWLPVHSLGAARFVAGRITPARSPSANLVDRIRRRLLAGWQRNPHLVARRPWLLHPSRKQQLGVVIAGPDVGVAGQPAPEMIMKIGGSSTDQPILFVFGSRSERATDPAAATTRDPDAVIKVPTLAEEIESSHREAEVLTALSKFDPPVTRIPRPVEVRRYRNAVLHAFGQTYAPGRPMSMVVTPDSLSDHAAPVGEWLVGLAETTARSTDPARATASLRKAVAELDRSLRTLPDGADLRRGLTVAVDGIDRSVSVERHNDLGPWNVHVTATGEITVIDWADATTDGIPGCDFIHFLAHLAICAHDAYRPDRRNRLIADLVDPETALGRRVRWMTADHVTRVGLDPEQIPHLRILTWALDLLRRPPEERTTGLYLELLQAEIRRWTSQP